MKLWLHCCGATQPISSQNGFVEWVAAEQRQRLSRHINCHGDYEAQSALPCSKRREQNGKERGHLLMPSFPEAKYSAREGFSKWCRKRPY